MKQTAVEWLQEQLKINNYLSENAYWLIDEAKEMEKEITSNFESASRPLMKYLAQNHHPHTSAYVRNDLAELLEGQQIFGTDDYILD
jgi:hypothetical protein